MLFMKHRYQIEISIYVWIMTFIPAALRALTQMSYFGKTHVDCRTSRALGISHTHKHAEESPAAFCSTPQHKLRTQRKKKKKREENHNEKEVSKGSKRCVTKTPNNPSCVVLFSKGLSETREESWGGIPGSSEAVAGIVARSFYRFSLSHTHAHTHFDTSFRLLNCNVRMCKEGQFY